jgi:protocatechuate 3,4-dioxygenase beta subunit
MKTKLVKGQIPEGARLYIMFPFCLAFTLLFFSSCGQTTSGLTKIESDLRNGSATVSSILTSENYMDLHGDPDFRSLMRKYAPQGKISIVSAREPGARIQLKGQIVGKDQKPRKNVLFYFYHTMHDGLYAVNKDAPGQPFQGQQELAKLFGYIRTDQEGKFEINTIKPAGYPGERFPAHVHLEIYDEGGKIMHGTEFQFEDDPRLDKETREASVRYGNLVADNTGTKEKPVYFFKITLPN